MKTTSILCMISGSAAIMSGLIFMAKDGKQIRATSKQSNPTFAKKARLITQLLQDARSADERNDSLAEEEKLKQALAAMPKLRVANFLLAKMYDKLGRHDEALANYRIALAGTSWSIIDPAAMIRFGELSQAAGDLSNARKAFSQATSPYAIYFGAGIAPRLDDSVNIEFLHGMAYASKACAGGFLENQMEDVKKAYALAPNSSYVCYAYAMLLYRMDQNADARKIFDRAIALTPAKDRSAVEAEVNRLGNIQTYSEITTYDSNGKVISKRRLSRKLENRPLVYPPHRRRVTPILP